MLLGKMDKTEKNEKKEPYMIDHPYESEPLSIDSSSTCDRNTGEGFFHLSPGCTEDGVNRYNNDFFQFRDRTHNMSQMREDPVDRVNGLRLDQSRFKGMKIKDIYDYLTQNPTNY